MPQFSLVAVRELGKNPGLEDGLTFRVWRGLSEVCGEEFSDCDICIEWPLSLLKEAVYINMQIALVVTIMMITIMMRVMMKVMINISERD